MWEGPEGVFPSIGEGLGENFGTFSLEMAHFGANSVVFYLKAYFNRNVRQLLLGPEQLLYNVVLADEGVRSNQSMCMYVVY